MRHPLRHALVCFWFLCMFLCALRAPDDSSLRADVARQQDTYEQTVEQWSPARRAHELARSADTRNGFLLYAGTPLPNASDVFDDRTLVSPDLLADLHLQLHGSPALALARRNLREKVRRDRHRRSLQERIARVHEEGPLPWLPIWNASATMSLAWAKAELDGGPLGVDRLDRIARRRVRSPPPASGEAARETDSDDDDQDDEEDYGNRVMDALPRSSRPPAAHPLLASVDLETDEARRVPPLSASIPRTPPGSVTEVSPSDFYKVHEAYLRAYERRRLGQPFPFYQWPRQRRAHRPRYAWRKFYIALNLHENVEAIPYLTGALIAFLEDEIAPFFDLATSVVVTIYANASPDLTGPLVRSFLIPYLQRAGVRNVYATVKGTCGGYLRRYPQLQDRIEWMACLRNRALAPLQALGSHVFTAVAGDEVGFEEAAHTPSRSPADASPDPTRSVGTFADDDELVVLFLNDIYFRAEDLTRLLESVPEPHFLATTRPDGAHKVSDTPPDHTARGTSFDMACGMDFYFSFYDTWVSRDRLGRPFLPLMPYSDDPPTRAAFARILSGQGGRRGGSPTGAGASADGAATDAGTAAIPVKCCWNGAAALRGSIFLPPPPSTPAAAATAPSLAYPSGLVFDPVPAERVAAVRAQVHRYLVQLLAVRLHGVRAQWRAYQRQAARALVLVPPPEAAEPLNETIASLAGALRRHVADHALMRRVPVQARVLGEALLFTRDRASHREGEKDTSLETLTGPLDVAALAELTELTELAVRTESNRSDFVARVLPRWRGIVARTGAVPTIPGEQNNKAPPPALLPPFPLSGNFSEVDDLFLEMGGLWYVARHPVVRFRHPFTPSFGAAAAAAVTAPPDGDSPPAVSAVPDKVCLSSECLLICQDVMHAALVRRGGRLPVILMNPSVRVAYEWDHFHRVAFVSARAGEATPPTPPPSRQAGGGADGEGEGQGTEDTPRGYTTPSWLGGLYGSPHVYRLCAALRDAWRAWLWLTSVFATTATPDLRAEAMATDVSAADDWTGADPSYRMRVTGHDGVYDVNVTQLTLMTCFRPGGDEAGPVVGLLLRALYALLIVVTARWAIADAVRHVDGKVAAVQARMLGLSANPGRDGAGAGGSGRHRGSPPAASASLVQLLPEERVLWRVVLLVRRVRARCVEENRTRPVLGVPSEPPRPPRGSGGQPRGSGHARQWGQRIRHALWLAMAVLRTAVQRRGPPLLPEHSPRRRVASTGAAEAHEEEDSTIAIVIASSPVSVTPPPSPLPVGSAGVASGVVGAYDRVRYRDSPSLAGGTAWSV